MLYVSQSVIITLSFSPLHYIKSIVYTLYNISSIDKTWLVIVNYWWQDKIDSIRNNWAYKFWSVIGRQFSRNCLVFSPLDIREMIPIVWESWELGNLLIIKLYFMA